jgi:amino acid transporter
MKIFVLGIVTILIFYVFYRILKKKDSIVYFGGGRWWLTWLSLGIITLMDELTSIFYAPAEAHRFIGNNAIFFIILTSLFIRFASTRMVEIAQILELNGIRGGGVYSFSYIVLGPTISFIAVASILVDYILTACISTVSAVENGTTFFQISGTTKLLFQMVVIWGIATLNIIGIKENAKFTFGIFFLATLILINLVVSSLISLDAFNVQQISNSFSNSAQNIGSGIFKGYGFIILGIASCILAYSGVESVIQTAGYVKDWKVIRKSYLFLALSVGIVTPLIVTLSLSSNIDVVKHTGDLIPYWATVLNGPIFGLCVGFLASLTLIMAVNTAFVASSELLEKVAERYNFLWIIATNKRQSLYRIHISFAIFNTIIIFITGGSQDILAEMYALGLIASFTINMGSLIIYRYFQGTGEIKAYYTSRFGTLITFIIFLSCFIYLALHKPYGTMLWVSVTFVFLLLGLSIARKRAPEKKEIKQTDSKMDIVFYFAENTSEVNNIYFLKPEEKLPVVDDKSSVFITFYHPRKNIPPKITSNYFRFPIIGNQLLSNIYAIIELLKYELPDQKFKIHINWPLSSWIDRLAIGVMVFEIMQLPKKYPEYDFSIEHSPVKNK